MDKGGEHRSLKVVIMWKDMDKSQRNVILASPCEMEVVGV